MEQESNKIELIKEWEGKEKKEEKKKEVVAEKATGKKLIGEK